MIPKLVSMILIPSIEMGVKMNESHGSSAKVPGSPEVGPGQAVVSSNTNYSLGGVE